MIELNSFICGDCMDYLPQFPDKYFELAIVDPPYGINIQKSGRLKRYNTDEIWDDSIPNEQYFCQLFRVSQNQIIWGGNYFYLPPTRCFLIWDKKQPENISFASCEFAWTSFDMSAKTFYYSPHQEIEKRIHTTQKPVALYDWILSKYAKQGDKILDTQSDRRVALYHVTKMDLITLVLRKIRIIMILRTKDWKNTKAR